MTRRFQKAYAITDVYYEEIELEEDEIEGMTEEEILELADRLLWEKASNSTKFDITDDAMDEPEEI